MLYKNIANMITITGMLIGLTALYFTHIGEYLVACLLILTVTLFDRLDGSVARRLNIVSDFGEYLDTTADIISFIIAPSYLFIKLDLLQNMYLTHVVIIIYIVCGLYRLYRYHKIKMAHMFLGVPVTIAAIFMCLLIMINLNIEHSVLSHILSVLFIFLISFLMVSKSQIKRI